MPYCQDTGFVVCFVELGQDVHVTGGLLTDAINEGVRQGYTEGYLRASIVRSPFDRVNTGDNTPAVIHLEVVAGRGAPHQDHGQGRRLREPLEVQDADAGRGHGGREGLHHRVRQDGGAGRVPAPRRSGWASAARSRRRRMLSKKALFRELGRPNPDPALDALEQSCSTAPTASASGPRATAATRRRSASRSWRTRATSRACRWP